MIKRIYEQELFQAKAEKLKQRQKKQETSLYGQLKLHLSALPIEDEDIMDLELPNLQGQTSTSSQGLEDPEDQDLFAFMNKCDEESGQLQRMKDYHQIKREYRDSLHKKRPLPRKSNLSSGEISKAQNNSVVSNQGGSLTGKSRNIITLGGAGLQVNSMASSVNRTLKPMGQNFGYSQAESKFGKLNALRIQFSHKKVRKANPYQQMITIQQEMDDISRKVYLPPVEDPACLHKYSSISNIKSPKNCTRVHKFVERKIDFKELMRIRNHSHRPFDCDPRERSVLAHTRNITQAKYQKYLESKVEKEHFIDLDREVLHKLGQNSSGEPSIAPTYTDTQANTSQETIQRSVSIAPRVKRFSIQPSSSASRDIIEFARATHMNIKKSVGKLVPISRTAQTSSTQISSQLQKSTASSLGASFRMKINEKSLFGTTDVSSKNGDQIEEAHETEEACSPFQSRDTRTTAAETAMFSTIIKNRHAEITISENFGLSQQQTVRGLSQIRDKCTQILEKQQTRHRITVSKRKDIQKSNQNIIGGSTFLPAPPSEKEICQTEVDEEIDDEGESTSFLEPYQDYFGVKAMDWTRNEAKKIDDKYQRMNYRALIGIDSIHTKRKNLITVTPMRKKQL